MGGSVGEPGQESPRGRASRHVIFAALAICAAVAAGAARADEAVACWRRFFASIGAEERHAEDLVRFRFVGYGLRVPAAYLRGATPRPELGPNDAVRIFASPPHFAPLTPAQSSGFLRPGSSGVWVTMEGHPHFLHGQARLDAMMRLSRHENRDAERDANGFLIFRAAIPEAAADWAEIYVWPGDPERMFHCGSGLPPSRFPQCVAERWIGGLLRLSMTFPKALLPGYLALEASLEHAMSCALNPEELLDRAWPPRVMTPR